MRVSVAHLIGSRPWAVERSSALWRELHRLASAVEVEIDAEAFAARQQAASFRERVGAQKVGAVEVIPVQNIITQRFTWLTWMLDGTALEWLREAIAEAVADPDVAAIVLDVDSPGGSVDGLIEFAADLRSLAAQKPVVAVTNPMNASAALWATAGATEMILTPSGEIGSVGVYALHMDFSAALEADGVKPTFVYAGEFKTEGNPYEPLTEGALAALQAEVDHFYKAFLADVAKGRGTQVSTVAESYGQGRMVMPAAAQAAGMVDRVDTLAATVKRYQRGAAATGTSRRAEGLDPELVADAEPPDPSAEPPSPPEPDPAWVALKAADFNRRLRNPQGKHRSN